MHPNPNPNPPIEALHLFEEILKGWLDTRALAVQKRDAWREAKTGVARVQLMRGKVAARMSRLRREARARGIQRPPMRA